MIPALFDHLWQSTAFAGGAGLLTLLFRRNGAGVRYALWFAATLKFLVPFSLLAALGDLAARPVAPAVPALLFAMRPAVKSLSLVAPALSPAAATPDVASVLLLAWSLGFAAVVFFWTLRWLQLNDAVYRATALPLTAPVPVKSSVSFIEPGLVGILRPVLLLPEGIAARLSAAEMQAIVAHELCHLRRRDNLTAAIHMLAEALFWFYPPVWWIGARLIEERERACDEAVLASGNDPRVYAEGILKVCRFYVQSPLACAAGISGANLKKRMETIMENRFALRLNAAKKLLLGTAALSAIVVPMLTGLATAAQTPSPDEIGKNLAEQARPRMAVAIAPRVFDNYAGYYRMEPNQIYHISRSGMHYFEGVIGQRPVEMFPESDTKFFLKGLSLPAQFSFTADGREMVLHQSGAETHAVRIAEADGVKAQADLARRIADKIQSPGTEAALRHQIDGLMSGRPDYERMVPVLAAGTRQMLPALHAKLQGWGRVESVAFTGVDASGMDVYVVTFAKARSRWEIAPLTPDGRIAGIFFGEES